MYTCSTLENTSVRTLFLAYLQAFEDFPSTRNVSIGTFQNMLQIRGYLPEISMGAFDQSKHVLAGFILNGFRIWNGKRTVYDILTGTTPSYRRQGIADTLLEKLRIVVKQRHAEQYVTEVKKENNPAIGLYKKQGFKIRRELSSYTLKKGKHRKMISPYRIEYFTEITRNEWERLESFWEFQPSWENSISSVSAGKGMMKYALVCSDNKSIGYGVVDENTGDIPQLAVHRDYRHNRIAGSIVSDLFEKVATDQLNIHNVDDTYDAMKSFLLKVGFEKTIGQYEIILSLQ